MHNMLNRERYYPKVMPEVDQAILDNEWSHVEVKLIDDVDFYSMEDTNLCDANPEMGIHVFKDEKSMETDVRFTDPYGKRKPDDYQDELFVLLPVSDYKQLFSSIH
ncbi:disease resistance protein (TIR-NBS-LRR class) [Trifolium medium]|uniref:Disease resistance protein (TIR-NBS-LRR class) n=1 Tax=Trifolium medium TaxID=97028 RepID=A0A392PFM6_9FABA|nr:disease resistance protein (TIR-NBS-LRR class) [Trifolium medium]